MFMFTVVLYLKEELLSKNYFSFLFSDVQKFVFCYLYLIIPILSV